MAGQGKGSVINVSSVAGHVGLRRSVPYCATKGGVELLTKGLALDWAKRGVRVNTLAPGYFETDLTAGMRENDALAAPLLAHTPLGRFGKLGRRGGGGGVPGLRRIGVHDRGEPGRRRRLDGGLRRGTADPLYIVTTPKRG